MSNTKELGITKKIDLSKNYIVEAMSIKRLWNYIDNWFDPTFSRERINHATKEIKIFINSLEEVDNQTGLTPKQLLEQRDELLKCCQNFVDKVESGKARSKKSYSEMKKAIKLITDEKT